LLPSAVALSGCGTTIQPGQAGIKYVALSKPALQKEALREGFYFQWLWNDIVTYDITWQSNEEELEVLTADDLHVPVTGVVVYRAKPDMIYELHTQIGPRYYDKVIRPTFLTLLRTEFANHKHNDLARDSGTIEQQVLGKLSEKLAGQPLDLDRVAIRHIRFDPDVTKSISDKLVKKQVLEQKQFEQDIAQRDAEIARIKARGEGDAAKLRAEGEGQALVIKGKAQADAQEAIAKTLTRDYLLYKAFDSPSSRYYFLPTGKDGLPLILNAEPGPSLRSSP